METVAGTVYTVEINDYLVTSDQFAKLEEDEDQLIMWSGPASDQPDYSWTYVCEDVDMDSPNLEYDPRIEISKLGTNDVANIMQQSEGGLVMDFAFEGDLPGTATIYVAAEGYFDDGETVELYCFNEDERCFEAAEVEEIVVEDGYASFEIDHCSTWALSADDLTAYEVQETNTPGAAAESASDDGATAGDGGSSAVAEEAASEGGLSPAAILLIIAAIIVVAAVIAALVVRNRRAKAAAVGEAAETDEPAEAADEPAEADESAVEQVEEHDESC